ncbi:hypothetical protein [Hydrogenophaga sp.]|uniref:hypothetical protein n=1 Tax=Hydrogenophaga sp. TaxID=1904254 RepID=UPI0035B4B0BA
MKHHTTSLALPATGLLASLLLTALPASANSGHAAPAAHAPAAAAAPAAAPAA